MTLLELDQVSVRIGGRSLLRQVSLRLAPGELLGLIGPNGAGKSTLLKAVVQLLPPAGRARSDRGWSGRIRLLGEDIRALPPRERARRLAYLSQDDRVQWPIRVEDLVALGRHPHQSSWRSAKDHASDRAGSRGSRGSRAASQPGSDDCRAIEAALRTTDILHLRARRATEISGGERARARLARALAVEAPLLLADEPVAALDPLHQLKVMSYLRAYCQGSAQRRGNATGRGDKRNQSGNHRAGDQGGMLDIRDQNGRIGDGYLDHHDGGLIAPQAPPAPPGRAAIVVMHDLTLASRFCDRLLLLHQGEPIALGPPEEVLSPERLRDIYGIRAIRGQVEEQSYVLPWALSDDQANPPPYRIPNAPDRRRT